IATQSENNINIIATQTKFTINIVATQTKNIVNIVITQTENIVNIVAIQTKFFVNIVAIQTEVITIQFIKIQKMIKEITEYIKKALANSCEFDITTTIKLQIITNRLRYSKETRNWGV
ncbi:26694_t:CDS:2, partial [Dentiscutata erythropus]